MLKSQSMGTAMAAIIGTSGTEILTVRTVSPNPWQISCTHMLTCLARSCKTP